MMTEIIDKVDYNIYIQKRYLERVIEIGSLMVKMRTKSPRQ